MEHVRLSERVVPASDRFTKRICFNHSQVLAFVLTFSPGQALPPHRHPGSAVVLQVLQGQGTLTINGEERPIQSGDAVLAEGDEVLAATNTGSDSLALFVTLSPNPTNPAYAKELG